MIKFENVSKSFSSEIILENINFKLNDTSLYCLKGRSGSGKTTIFRLIADIIKPDSGNIIHNYENDIKKHIYYSNDEWNLLNNLTVKDNLEFYLDKFEEEYANEIIKKLNLNYLLDKKCFSLSSGEKQKVSIIIACAINKDIIILDEPLANLDKESCVTFFELIKEKSKNCLVIASTLTDNVLTKNCDHLLNLKYKKIEIIDNTIANNESVTKINKKKLNVLKCFLNQSQLFFLISIIFQLLLILILSYTLPLSNISKNDFILDSLNNSIIDEYSFEKLNDEYDCLKGIECYTNYNSYFCSRDNNYKYEIRESITLNNQVIELADNEIYIFNSQGEINYNRPQIDYIKDYEIKYINFDISNISDYFNDEKSNIINSYYNYCIISPKMIQRILKNDNYESLYIRNNRFECTICCDESLSDAECLVNPTAIRCLGVQVSYPDYLNQTYNLNFKGYGKEISLELYAKDICNGESVDVIKVSRSNFEKIINAIKPEKYSDLLGEPKYYHYTIDKSKDDYKKLINSEDFKSLISLNSAATAAKIDKFNSQKSVYKISNYICIYLILLTFFVEIYYVLKSNHQTLISINQKLYSKTNFVRYYFINILVHILLLVIFISFYLFVRNNFSIFF